MLEMAGLEPLSVNYFQESNNSMAEFPGAVDGFVLLQMETDERQNNKIYTGLEDGQLYSETARSEPVYVIAVGCMN
jgi:hypothetical protein